MLSRADQPPIPLIRRILAEVVLIGHAAFALGWWWLMPRGFAIGHIRFWMNEVWPLALLFVSLAGVWSLVRRRPDWTKVCLLSLGIVALSTTVTASLTFPDIKRIVLLLSALIGLFELGLASTIATPSLARKVIAGPIIAALSFGAFMPLAQRAEQPSTIPLNEPCPWAEVTNGGTPLNGEPQSVGAFNRVMVLPSTGAVTIRLGRVRLEIEPLLTFESTSSSGGWSILSRQVRDRGPSFRRLVEMSTGRVEGGGNLLLFGGSSDWLSVEDQGLVKITAFSRISEPVYSHLNTFCKVSIYGHENLELTFSPCGSIGFEPRPADYPVGRPARFAYCDTDRKFLVMEAQSGEKGPFTELGKGRLEFDGRLSLGIVDNGAPIATVHFDDWASQLSSALSPTAGWDVPVNAVEFQRSGDARRDPVMVWITLAATAVGRGWDTVGHTAGIYRNQVVVEVANP